MSTKQTDASQKTEEIKLSDFLPGVGRSNVGGINPTNELEAEFQKAVEKEVAGNDIATNDAIQEDETDYTLNSLQTEATNSKKTSIPTTVPKRITSKQRKESLDDYRNTFLSVPKLEDRKPVFISRDVRDKIDEIVHRLGGRGRSVSGFIENLARHHLDIYQEDVEQWKKL